VLVGELGDPPRVAATDEEHVGRRARRDRLDDVGAAELPRVEGEPQSLDGDGLVAHPPAR
jgi:hypothetical protein